MQHATERVERPGESQEALDGKKLTQRYGNVIFVSLFSVLFGFATPILELIQCYHLFLIDSH